MFHCIFDEDERIKPNLMVTPAWVDLLLLWELEIESKYRVRSLVVTAIERTISALGFKDLVVAEIENEPNDGLALTIAECSDLRFARIDGTRFAIRRQS